MQRFQDKLMLVASVTRPLLRLPILLFALTAGGTAVGQQAQPNGVADSRIIRSTYTTYRVVNLAAGRLAAPPDINAKGQVAFSMQAGGTRATGYLYDGTAVRNIGTLGGNEVLVTDLNDLGQVAGRDTVRSLGLPHAFVWSAGSGMVDIGASPGVTSSGAAAINNNGVVTGTFHSAFAHHAFRWTLGSGLEDLGALTEEGASFGEALNEAGDIAGQATTANDRRHAVIWTRRGGPIDIDAFDSVDSTPVAVGARGEVAGNRLLSQPSTEFRGFLWTRASGMVDIGTAGGTEAIVLAMTPGLHMAGFINFANRPQHAMSWTRASGTRDLGTLGGQTSRAIDVNASGQIVGFAQNRAGGSRAFVWTARWGMLDLNRYLRHAPPGLVLDDAVAINDSGAIVATSNAGLVLLRPEQKCGCGHALGPVVAPAVVKAGVPMRASMAFVDEDRVGTRSVTWSWGDGSAAQAGRVRESDRAGNADASHSFAAPGIYTVTVTVVDRRGRSTAVSHDVVVTAASGDTLAGAGTLMSPAGALAQAPLYAGKASFRLIAPRSMTAQAERVPAALQFDLPGLAFRSHAFRLLGRQGTQQVFEGSGTVGGADGYRFRLPTSATVAGGGQGGFVLKIWHTDPGSRTDVVDNDNARAPSGTAAGRVIDGSIVLE